MPVALSGLDDLRRRAGTGEFAVSDWVDVTQERIDRFAEATADRQWVHVDRDRAAAESPFGTTVAHGFLTLSLLSTLLQRAITLPGVHLGVNYGVDHVRFASPVPQGSRIRGRFGVLSTKDMRGALKVVWSATIEREGSSKPCCVAEWIIVYYPETTA